MLKEREWNKRKAEIKNCSSKSYQYHYSLDKDEDGVGETAQQLGVLAALPKVKVYKRTFMSDTKSPKSKQQF